MFHAGFAKQAELSDYYGAYYSAQNLAFSPLNEARYASLLATFEVYRTSGRILDVGCGAGHFLHVAISRGWDAYGTEVAPGTFEQLSRLGIKYSKGDLKSADYPDGFFDVVYCSEVLEHVDDPGGLLRELRRIVRIGGLAYLTTPNYNSLSRRLIGERWRVICGEHICYFTPAVLERALHDAGFTRIEITTRNIDPNELRRAWRKDAEPTVGFQSAATEQLRNTVEQTRILRLLKFSLNQLLSAASAGDTIVARAHADVRL